MSTQVSCKELIDIFRKVGGKLVCTYDTRQCTLLKENKSCNIQPENKVDIGSLLCDFAYSGEYTKCVTTFPESERKIRSGAKDPSAYSSGRRPEEYEQSRRQPFVQETIHDYQEKGVGGFTIELIVDEDGRWSSPPQPK